MQMTSSWKKQEEWLKINSCIAFSWKMLLICSLLRIPRFVSFCKIPTFFMHKMKFNTMNWCAVSFSILKCDQSIKNFLGNLGARFLDSQCLNLNFISVQKANITGDFIILFFNNSCPCENLIVTHIDLIVNY